MRLATSTNSGTGKLKGRQYPRPVGFDSYVFFLVIFSLLIPKAQRIMKRFFFASAVIAIAVLISFNSSCSQKTAEEEEIIAIENTLKSVSLFLDTTYLEPAEFLASLERINQAIDSIGYPDAGYQLWIVQSDTVDDFRFMLNGFWPDQAAYDEIHNHELYRSAIEAEDEIWNKGKYTWYNRFQRVK
jgi:hypothetical protein